MIKQPFKGLQQGCTHCRKALSLLPRAQQQDPQDTVGQDDAAYVKRLLGDSARRLPKQLSVSPMAASYTFSQGIMLAKAFCSTVQLYA